MPVYVRRCPAGHEHESLEKADGSCDSYWPNRELSPIGDKP